MTEDASARRPRLLVLASTYPRWKGDPEPGFVHELARRLTSEFDVTVLGPHAPGAAPDENLDGVHVVRYRYAPARFETLVNDGGIVTNLRRHPLKWLLLPGFIGGQIWHAWRLVRRWEPDVLHAHWLIPQGLVIALLGRISRHWGPYLVTSHGSDLFGLRAKPWQAVKRFVSRKAAAITVVGSVMRDELAGIGVDSRKVHIEPMGVDLVQRFSPDPSTPRTKDQLLFVGRLVESKGVHHLIDAMPAIRLQRPAARLDIVGFGPQEAALRVLVKRRGLSDCVRFLGAQPQQALPSFYRRSALFVAPFTEGAKEGLGLVLVEAAGCGCPIVAGAVPGVRDVVGSGEDVWLVPPGEVEALAAACIDALRRDSAEAQARAERLRSTLLARFDWSARSACYRDLLRDIIARGSGASSRAERTGH